MSYNPTLADLIYLSSNPERYPAMEGLAPNVQDLFQRSGQMEQSQIDQAVENLYRGEGGYLDRGGEALTESPIPRAVSEDEEAFDTEHGTAAQDCEGICPCCFQEVTLKCEHDTTRILNTGVISENSDGPMFLVADRAKPRQAQSIMQDAVNVAISGSCTNGETEMPFVAFQSDQTDDLYAKNGETVQMETPPLTVEDSLGNLLDYILMDYDKIANTYDVSIGTCVPSPTFSTKIVVAPKLKLTGGVAIGYGMTPQVLQRRHRKWIQQASMAEEGQRIPTGAIGRQINNQNISVQGGAVLYVANDAHNFTTPALNISARSFNSQSNPIFNALDTFVSAINQAGDKIAQKATWLDDLSLVGPEISLSFYRQLAENASQAETDPETGQTLDWGLELAFNVGITGSIRIIDAVLTAFQAHPVVGRIRSIKNTLREGVGNSYIGAQADLDALLTVTATIGERSSGNSDSDALIDVRKPYGGSLTIQQAALALQFGLELTIRLTGELRVLFVRGTFGIEAGGVSALGLQLRMQNNQETGEVRFIPYCNGLKVFYQMEAGIELDTDEDESTLPGRGRLQNTPRSQLQGTGAVNVSVGQNGGNRAFSYDARREIPIVAPFDIPQPGGFRLFEF